MAFHATWHFVRQVSLCFGRETATKRAQRLRHVATSFAVLVPYHAAAMDREIARTKVQVEAIKVMLVR